MRVFFYVDRPILSVSLNFIIEIDHILFELEFVSRVYL